MACIILIVFFVIRLGFRDIPIERDEGLYAYSGYLLLHGRVPYVDFYEMKPPGLFYSYAVLNALSGGDVVRMHVWMAVLVCIGGLFLYRMASRLFDPGSALFTVLGYAVLTLSPHASGYSIQADHLVAFFGVAGSCTLLNGLASNRRHTTIVAGMLLCWSALIKQNGVFFALFGMLMIAIHHRKDPRRIARSLTDLALLAGGASTPMAALALAMVFQGNWKDFVFWTMEYPKGYATAVPWARGSGFLMKTLADLFHDAPGFWTVGVLGMMTLWATRADLSKKLMSTAFFVMAALSVVPGLRFYGHYFLQFMPALALGSGAAFFSMRNIAAMPSVRHQLFAPIATMVFLAGTLVTKAHYYFHPDLTAIMRDVYGSNPFPEARSLADRLSADYHTGDGLLVIGSEPELYAYTHAECPTRHLYLAVMVQGHPLEPRWRRELLADLAEHPPKYMVWVQHETSWMPAEGIDQSFLETCWNTMYRDYVPIAWYERTSTSEPEVISGEEARGHHPRGSFFMMLAQRRPTSSPE